MLLVDDAGREHWGWEENSLKVVYILNTHVRSTGGPAVRVWQASFIYLFIYLNDRLIF